MALCACPIKDKNRDYEGWRTLLYRWLPVVHLSSQAMPQGYSPYSDLFHAAPHLSCLLCVYVGGVLRHVDTFSRDIVDTFSCDVLVSDVPRLDWVCVGSLHTWP